MNKNENILKEIFFDENNNWDRFRISTGKVSENSIGRSRKFRLCGEKEAGFSLFACEMCGE